MMVGLTTLRPSENAAIAQSAPIVSEMPCADVIRSHSSPPVTRQYISAPARIVSPAARSTQSTRCFLPARWAMNGPAAGPTSRAVDWRNRIVVSAAPTQNTPARMCTIRSTTM